MRVLVTGATGFIGGHVCRLLASEGDSLRVVSRHPEGAAKRIGVECEAVAWDAERDPFPAGALEGIDAVVHLLGESIASGRWNADRKRRIRASRVDGTRRLMEAIAQTPNRPRVIVSAAATGIYGEQADEWLSEDSARGSDFLADLCREWEDAVLAPSVPGLRRVVLRFGVVLGTDGGALEQMLPVFRAGMGGRLGSGRQWMSWIEVSDLARMILYSLREERVRGALNAVAPHPVTNSEFTASLGRALGRPAFFVVPGFALRLAMGEMAKYALVSQRVSARKIQDLGFQFRYPELPEALASLLGRD